MRKESRKITRIQAVRQLSGKTGGQVVGYKSSQQVVLPFAGSPSLATKVTTTIDMDSITYSDFYAIGNKNFQIILASSYKIS